VIEFAADSGREYNLDHIEAMGYKRRVLYGGYLLVTSVNIVFTLGDEIMPIVDGVGYSEATKGKIRKLVKIVDMHISVTQAVINKNSQYLRTYRYVDLTSGKGSTPDGTVGSPLVFLEKAHEKGLTYRADFIEEIDKNIQELKSAISGRGFDGAGLHFHCCDYKEKVRELFPAVNRKQLGLVFVDPSGDLPDFETLQYIGEVRPRMEILIYLASTNVKRQYQYTNKYLEDYLGKIGKNHWLISTPSAGDQFKWIFLLGSGAPIFKDYKSIGIYRLPSDIGRELFEIVNLTEKQRIEHLQPRLFE
jgi:hypothetical protein